MHLTDQIQIRQDAWDTRDARLHEAGVERVICILLPTSVLVAAANGKNECLSVRYSSCEGNPPGWDAAFFEKVLANDLMIRDRNAVKQVYTPTVKQLLIPEAMHQQEHSRQLLRDIFHIGSDEQLGTLSCKADKAQLVYGYDLAVQEIAERYTGITEIRPLNGFQFQKAEKNSGAQVSCLLSETDAWLTLRDNGRLLWHHTIPYSNAEDIAFHILHACRQWEVNAETIQTHCTAVHPEASDTINRLKRFLPVADKGGDRWSPVLGLVASS
jgi:hypothetical protein